MSGVVLPFLFLLIVVTILISIAKGAPYVPTDKKTLDTILALAGDVGGKKVVDLGSGDGRVVIAFLAHGAYVTGYEISPILYLVSLFRLIFSPQKKSAHMYLKSFWRANLSEFDVIVVFGISYIMKDLEEKIKREAKKGTIVMSHAYEFPDWKPQKEKDAVYVYKV